MQEADWLRQHVSELTDQQEVTEATPWAVSDAPDDFIAVMLRGIVGFRIEITRLEGKLKMSQNREAAERKGVVDGLRARWDWRVTLSWRMAWRGCLMGTGEALRCTILPQMKRLDRRPGGEFFH